jgi:hypothetical protein
MVRSPIEDRVEKGTHCLGLETSRQTFWFGFTLARICRILTRTDLHESISGEAVNFVSGPHTPSWYFILLYHLLDVFEILLGLRSLLVEVDRFSTDRGTSLGRLNEILSNWRSPKGLSFLFL